MSVTFCPATPIVHPTYGPMMHHHDVGPHLNLSNTNAAPLLHCLDLVNREDDGEEPDWIGSLPLDDFRGRLLIALAVAPEDPGRPTTLEQRTGGAVIIEGGRPAGYLQHRLRQLLDIADAAQAAGHSHIGWH